MPKRRGTYVLVLGLFMVSITKLSAKRFIQFIEEPKDSVVLRNQPAELRCNVSGVNNVKVSWIKDGKILDVSNDSRRTIQPHGSLRFSTIVRKKRNSPDDGVYQCVAETVVDGWTYKMLSQKATLTVAGMSKSLAESPSDLTVNEGETAIFRCQLKRSRPPITITWSKEGKNTDLTFNFRFRVLPSGILEIRSVLASDAGRYVCKATNERTKKSVTATAVLTVNPASVAPKAGRFLVKPNNAKSLHDKDVILECIVAGYPMPQVTWYKDGQQISPASSKRYTLYGTNNLQISSVQPVDSGKYECVIGSLKAAAYIQVFVPPKFINVPRDTTVMEDDAMTMQCDVMGHPTPKISWYYNGLPLPDADYIQITNNSLTYTEVIEDDRGIYQCFASNEGGEIMASAQLKVLVDVMTTTPISTPTTIATTAPELTPSPPKNVQVKMLSPTSVNVTWQAPDDPHGTIIRYTVLITRKGAGDLKMFISTNLFYMVDKLTPSTLYGCSIYATNQNKKFKNGLPSHEVKFQTMALPTPPASNMPPPRDVKVQALSSMALKVSWKAPAVIAFPIQNYTVEYQDMDSNIPLRSASAMKLEIALLKLVPYTRYSIRVTAQTKNGPGRTSTAVVRRTKSGRPKGPPESVQLDLFKAILVAHWQPPSQPNGNITKYLLKLKNINKGTVATFYTQDTKKSFLNFEKSTTYAFRVAAVTEAGRGEFSKWIRKDMPLKAPTENVVPGKPSNLRAQVRLGMIEVTWNPPLESHIIVRHYILSYGEGAPGHNYQQLPENTTSHLLGNLRASATYIIQVRAANKMGQGQPALEKVIMPGPNQGNPPLSDLRAVATKKRSLKLSWFDPQSPNHDTTYQIKFEKDNEFIYINTSRQTHLVQDLKAGTMYKFFIKRNKQQDYQAVSNSTIDEKPGPPKDVTVLLDPEVLFMKIQWNSPDEPNGEITDYNICWRPNTGSQATCKTVKGHELNSRISGIKENLTYTVEISAKNSAGEGKPSKPVIFTRNTANTPILTLTGQDSFKTPLPSPSTKVLASDVIKVAKTGDGASLTSDEKTLWIIIAVIAAITLIAIVVISVFLCKKRTRASYVSRKKPAADPYKAVANGGAKKKGTKDNYWIKQNAMELEPCERNNKGEDLSVAPTIPRNADEMKPLDSPFQSRKDHNSLLAAESDEESLPPNDNDRHSPFSFSGNTPSRLDEPYQPLPKVAPKPKSLNIYNSPFPIPHNADDFPSPPQESLDNYDDGPATSSDYGSEELVASDSNQPPVLYMPQKTSNGYVSVATDFDYPVKERGSNDLDSSALQSLMKDLDAIMAKEDRV